MITITVLDGTLQIAEAIYKKLDRALITRFEKLTQAQVLKLITDLLNPDNQ